MTQFLHEEGFAFVRRARPREITENLHQAELMVQEQADHIAEWVRLTGEKGVAEPHPLGGGSQRWPNLGHLWEHP